MTEPNRTTCPHCQTHLELLPISKNNRLSTYLCPNCQIQYRHCKRCDRIRQEADMKYDTSKACFTSECVPCYTERKKNERNSRVSRSPVVSPVKLGTSTEPSTLEVLKVEITNIKDILTQYTISEQRVLRAQHDCYLRCNHDFAQIAEQYWQHKNITDLATKVDILRYFSENKCRIVRLRKTDVGSYRLSINGRKTTNSYDSILECYLSVNL